jgi:hypothetical protein
MYLAMFHFPFIASFGAQVQNDIEEEAIFHSSFKPDEKLFELDFTKINGKFTEKDELNEEELAKTTTPLPLPSSPLQKRVTEITTEK